MDTLPLTDLLWVVRKARSYLRSFPYTNDFLAADALRQPCPAQAAEVAVLSLRGAIIRAAHLQATMTRAKPGRRTLKAASYTWAVLEGIDDLGCLPRREPKSLDHALRWLQLAENAIVREHAAGNGVRLNEVAALPLTETAVLEDA